jgi:hypothetical protein
MTIGEEMHDPILALKTEEDLVQLLGPFVDDMGMIKAKIASYRVLYNDFRKLFIESGVRDLEGKRFRLTVSEEERETLDPEMARSYLTKEQIESCTRRTKCFVVNVTSRTGKSLK